MWLFGYCRLMETKILLRAPATAKCKLISYSLAKEMNETYTHKISPHGLEQGNKTFAYVRYVIFPAEQREKN